MKIQIPKVIVPVPMDEFASELKGKYLYVWVNPPKTKLQEYDDLVTALQSRELETARQTLIPDEQKAEGGRQTGEGNGQRTVLSRSFDQLAHWLNLRKTTPAAGIDEKLLAWYAEIWSQGPDDTHWTVAELRETEDMDPSFLSWMISRTWQTRTDHLQRKKKA
jgi:hypothetical protein